ncbi:ABC transporter, phosphonate, periplasmic substrate-binding protein [Falsiruegeria litorea R37]|uniref:ABC transporter, phosphonate, periplasmic substrate-binding protein n=1 Tax=Falsiruegeria litorea R37 TaxID=1200284 RepID=A0A1Y5TAC6_9RHOB|nr:PhnD/SsuA/transferrin family substrate-binding protein [Falsiruegeria litorea]SLN57566.1 ABC transporter, phosphonate, periplasmic substrate-binding protein [Falsiruegeria litorea R37]
MTAMLGMYDMPALQDANDAFWAAIRTHLGDGPEMLDRERDFWDIWHDPSMVFSQTCGMPYRTKLHGTVTLIGTPDYGLPDCPPGYYYSTFVARSDDPRPLDELVTGTFAYNEPLSQSGWAAPTTHLHSLGLKVDTLLQSGGHALSAKAVAEGRADLAALDALTWVLLTEHEPNLASKLRVVTRTEPTPTLPFVTAQSHDPAPIAAAVRAAIAAMDEDTRQLLHIRGLIDIPAEVYLAVPTPPSPAEKDSSV